MTFPPHLSYHLIAITSVKPVAKPILMAPNAQWDQEAVAELLQAAPWLTTLSHHMYPLGSGNLSLQLWSLRSVDGRTSTA